MDRTEPFIRAGEHIQGRAWEMAHVARQGKARQGTAGREALHKHLRFREHRQDETRQDVSQLIKESWAGKESSDRWPLVCKARQRMK